MPEFTDQSEIDAYYLNDPAPSRAAGVMWPALVERRIDRLFEIALRPDKVIHNELFQPSGALGNYAVKVRLTYVLGSFEKDFYDDLLTLAKIRNRFAHRIEANDFSDQRINAWLRNLQGTKSLPGLIDQLRARAKEELNPTAALHRKARPSTAGNTLHRRIY